MCVEEGMEDESEDVKYEEEEEDTKSVRRNV